MEGGAAHDNSGKPISRLKGAAFGPRDGIGKSLSRAKASTRTDWFGVHGEERKGIVAGVGFTTRLCCPRGARGDSTCCPRLATKEGRSFWGGWLLRPTQRFCQSQIQESP